MPTLTLALPVLLLAQAMPAPVGFEIGLVPVVRAASPPTTDGRTGPGWEKAVRRPILRTKATPPSSLDLSGSFRSVWDASALYVLVEVIDDRKGRTSQHPWEDDAVEVFIDGNGSRSGEFDADDRQLVFGREWDRVVDPKGGPVEGIRRAVTETPAGYDVEVAIPWSAVGVTPAAGSRIGLEVALDDNDGQGRKARLGWSDGEDKAWNDPRRFGRATLLAAAETTPAEIAARTDIATEIQVTKEESPPSLLVYHDIRTDAHGLIVPWYSDDPSKAFDHMIRLVWDFWRNLERCPNGVPYYLQHQVWKPEHDPRGLGGDQLSMALSSWNLLHGYLGDPAVVANMRLIADHWIEHGLTPGDAAWPNVPFPYNTDVHSARYDGDMRAGKGYLQPDKAGSFGAELVVLYEITGEPRYVDAAVGIADTLVRHAQAGDRDRSPWPFRVHYGTGAVFESDKGRFDYTTNWTGALRLFEGLIAMGKGRVADYERTRQTLRAWLEAYPLQNHKWGPFFEDINIYSDTQINAGTMALYLLEHPGSDPEGLSKVRAILDWCDTRFANRLWAKYGIVATNEQTAYEMPGNSHTAREASLELMWAERAGDPSRKGQAIRNLSWATYMVDGDGKNRYYRDDIWLTDGYGDYVRHYLRAMAAAPELAPNDQNHLLRTTSVIRTIEYGSDAVTYEKWDADSRERLKLSAWTPGAIEGGVMKWDAATRVLEVTASAKRVVIRRSR